MVHTFSICAIVTPMATETNSLLAATALISCRTVGTTPGLTDTNTTSDPSTTGPLSVIVFTPNDCSFVIMKQKHDGFDLTNYRLVYLCPYFECFYIW